MWSWVVGDQAGEVRPWVAQGESSRQWEATECSLTGKNRKKVGGKLLLSACKPDTGESPLSSYPSTPHTFSPEQKNRQSFLERAGPLEDPLLALSPMELVVYRSIFASAMCF